MYDIAVLGMGAVGALCVYEASKQGLSVIGIDQYDPPHSYGSTHGETRLIREAYSEGPEYVPLLRESLDLWRQLNTEIGENMFRDIGIQYIGPKDNPRMLSVRNSSQEYDIPLYGYTDNPSHKQTGFCYPEDWDHIYELNAGYITVEPAMRALFKAAKQKGATLSPNTKILDIEIGDTQCRVRTDTSEITAKKLIIALGPWAHESMDFLTPHLELERHTLHWFEDPKGDFTPKDGMMPWVVHHPEGWFFYGFPTNEAGLVKMSEHAYGDRVATTKDIKRDITPEDTDTIEAFQKQYMPSLSKRVHSSSCIYTMTKDGHFIIDHYPGTNHAVFAAGLSGHGYKFAPAMAQALIQMVMDGQTKKDWSLFKFSRFQ